MLLLEPVDVPFPEFGFGTLTKAETAEPSILVATQVTNDESSPGWQTILHSSAISVKRAIEALSFADGVMSFSGQGLPRYIFA
nr:hypothetical protein [Acinetobacter nosocomialis]